MLRLIVIDNIVANIENPLVESLLGPLCSLKKRAYTQSFSNRTMPLDHTDYYGTHVIVAKEQEKNDMGPVMAFKSVTTERCKQYNAKLPGIIMVDRLNSKIHSTAFQKNLAETNCHDHQVAYISSLAIEPRLSLENRIELLELIYPLWFYYVCDFGIKKAFSFGTVESKVFRILLKLGLSPLKFENQVLGPIISKIFYGQRAYIQVMDSCSPTCLQEARRPTGLDLWTNRIHFDDSVTTKRNSKSEQVVENYFKTAIPQ